MSLTAGVELRLGDETEIEFTPPYSGAPIRIRGVVRNRSGYRYGMEFVAGDDQELQSVQRLKAVWACWLRHSGRRGSDAQL